jgi:hypothetical protein
MRDVARSLACAIGALVILADPAVAQQAASASADPSAAQSAAQSTPVSPGTLTVERVPSGWVISPDVTMTEFNKDFGTLIGAYGGWMSDRTWLVGMGGYWLANNTHNDGMAYGGLVVQVLAHSDQRIGFAVKGLVGGGDATVTARYVDVYGSRPPYASPDVVFGHGNRPGRPSHQPTPTPPPITPNTQLVFHEGFFIAEPQAQVMWNVSSNVRLTFGAGYRIIAGADPVNDRLRGPIGSVSVEFGGGH